MARSIINEKPKIIVCPNNQNNRVILRVVTTNKIMQNLNFHIENFGYYLIRGV